MEIIINSYKGVVKINSTRYSMYHIESRELLFLFFGILLIFSKQEASNSVDYDISFIIQRPVTHRNKTSSSNNVGFQSNRWDITIFNMILVLKYKQFRSLLFFS